MKKSSRQYYFLLSGLFFFFFFTWSSSFSLISIWLEQTLGLTGMDTGIIFSAISIVALCLQPLYGFIQDKLGLKKNLLWLIGFLLLGSGPFFIFVYAPTLKYNIILGAALGGVYVGATFFSGIGALESYIERVSRIAGFEYGRARMWGSLGWAAATALAGTIININPDINFIIASSSAVVFLILLGFIKVAKIDAMGQLEYGKVSKLQISDALGLLKLSQFWALVIFVVGVSMYNVYDQQFSVYFSHQFATQQEGNRMYGFLNSLQVFLEAGGMALAPFLVNRIGAKNSLLLSGAIMTLRIIGSGAVEGPILISAMKLLHAVELPILLIAIFKFISTRFDHRLSATLYLVGFQFVAQVCASFLAPLAGYGYDQIGFADTYMIMGCITGVFMLIAAFLLKGDKQLKLVIGGVVNESVTY
ncbi:MFS transporter [Orbus sturtevantii]|uniref:MFS transporter n=1 Tax=Orbus sturtevantii TaxID=3074109 RepID=UPI00370DD13C